ncbi:MAG: S8 family serine peptidase [Actinomycetota bacterium]
MRLPAIALPLTLIVAVLIPPATADQQATGRYIVILRDNADPESTAHRHEDRYGAKADRFYHSVVRGYAANVPEDRVSELRKDPSVLMASKNRRFQAAACPDVDPQCTPTGVRRIAADSTSATGDGVQVAVLDSGIDLDHPDLAANVMGGADCIGPDTGNFDDGLGHGTHVAGTIAAIDNGTGVRGVAPEAKLWAVKILNNAGVGDDVSIMCGLEFVFDNAASIDVANMSLEAPIPNVDDGNCGLDNDDAFHLAICAVVEAGVTIVAAAGNHADDIKDVSPAAYDEVITATALSDWDGAPCGDGPDPTGDFPDDTFAAFSSYASTPGDRAHTIGAPGVDILSTWVNGYAFSDGTSMASPHVAGAAALYLEGNPTASPAQVRGALLESGELLGVNSGGKCTGTIPSHTDPSGLHPEPVVCALGCTLPIEASTPGVIRGNVWYLNNGFDATGNVPTFAYGSPSDRVVVGDWDGDGVESPGVVRGNVWYLNDDFDATGNVPTFAFGRSTDRVVVGDWDGDGVDSPGVVRGNVWYFNNGFDATGDASLAFGRTTDQQIVGNWDGDEDDDIAVRRGNSWFLRVPTAPVTVIFFAYGHSADRAVAGDWDGENP